MERKQAVTEYRVLQPSDIRRITEIVCDYINHNDQLWSGWFYVDGDLLTIHLLHDVSAPTESNNALAPISLCCDRASQHEITDKLKASFTQRHTPTVSPRFNVDIVDTLPHANKLGVFEICSQSAPITKHIRWASEHINHFLTQRLLSDELFRVKRAFQQQIQSKDQQIVLLSNTITAIQHQQSKLEQEMVFQQTHDPATKMLNRSGFENALQRMLQGAAVASNKVYLSVIFLHFTNGERVQARIGCEAFDRLLKEFEQKIHTSTPHISHIARVSTTEISLAAIIPALDDVFLPNLCTQLSSVAREGFIVGQHNIHLHAYMGVANSYHTSDATDLINNAYQASVACKESGTLVKVFSYADQIEQKEFNQLENYLLQAVRNDDLILHFQPQVNLTTGKWMGAEVLLRWKHPILGDVSNEALIHMAEKNGLIIEVGYFVLRSAIDRASEWVQIAPNFHLSVNVSAKQICSLDFAEKVIHLLEQNELPPANLELELTESCLVGNFDVARKNIEALKQHGVMFALDDFGTGYASFNYLKKLPFDSLKIDREFLVNVLYNKQDKAILKSIITIAKKLNKKVVVEGVETNDQNNFIRREQCDLGQGYFYAKPMPRDVFESQLIKQYPIPNDFIIR
ncbi:hypothetical protein BCU70_19070 [Vibrio sp. 10N.286.49.C2]|uniref:putative bifunctional diguanylate cyclase/phosphodiesterase n=1 Tax=unclassified Vibrio TaxID=2614977 RepID=UPI000C85535E|nr:MULTISPECIES: bifunctional diguanylate cyclase/phosphodiesterase [unclassified Vibrio]PMH34769.1 hypothetical protein BCU70_19070 [Vibrio sp. 10N.286.49.C2]PMH51442.1 hypothetical protein BCU66_17045 [Vibrio sp. 10N.286.49.B1]PMH79362.1 hypothetical protein BCU58_05470 [Vibrio sp. 10N.286.48.B7]